jgi:hypothetical protein
MNKPVPRRCPINVTAWITEKERAMLRRLAKSTGLNTVSSVLRLAIREFAEKRGEPVERDPRLLHR